ncbi:hypothetical protein NUW58_g266 [Xylaria curta]|uniref:Uncharacterized protein n=1 Tax=Xylaria curta TaxID=42375 RepID=A0ACC1PT91_9PEZI|nr:hypothetical protein NUW58_g266 [Xylaria curta]
MAAKKPNDPLLSTGAYTKFFLSALYDGAVLGLNFGLVWGCPARRVLLPLFAENLSQRHLDCGVGTGYFPANALNDGPARHGHRGQMTLLDLNPNCLDKARSAILTVAPQTQIQCVVADIRSPIPLSLQGSTFDSISMFNLYHCIPGGRSKLQAISAYKNLLSAEGVLTGSTILGAKHATGWFAPIYLRFYNCIGLFSNLEDTKEDVLNLLNSEFMEVETWLVGMVLLFRAKGPRR